MTREEELELLIAEQERDDTSFISTPTMQVSLDAPVLGTDGPSTVGAEFVGRDPWELVDAAIDLGLDPAEVAYSGTLVDHVSQRGEALADPRKIAHGTLHGYTRQKCKCARCKGAMAAWKKQRRAELRAQS